MIRFLLLLMTLAAVASQTPAHGQQVQRLGQAAGFAGGPRPSLSPALSTIPDSVRQKVGYHHWKGGAIGAGVGAVGGLLLALAAHGQCADCRSDSPSIAGATVIGAGLGGAFGFLVGAATPRYHWVPAEHP